MCNNSIHVFTIVVLDFDGHHTEHEQARELVSKPRGEVETHSSVWSPGLITATEEARTIRAYGHTQDELPFVCSASRVNVVGTRACVKIFPENGFNTDTSIK
jgi:hypothetical protein